MSTARTWRERNDVTDDSEMKVVDFRNCSSDLQRHESVRCIEVEVRLRRDEKGSYQR